MKMADTKFDHHSRDFVTRHREVYDELRSSCPVARSSTHGGFWVLSKYEHVKEVALDDERFSSEISLLIPPGDVDPLIPLQTDPPRLQRYRQALLPFFTASAIDSLAPAIRADAESCILAMVQRGCGEIISELASPLPARMTMRLLGLNPDDWHIFADPIHAATFAHPESPVYIKAETDIRAFNQIIAEAVDKRVVTPRADMISALLAQPDSAEALTPKEVIDLVRMIIFGGMDTVTGAIGNILAMLAQRSDLRSSLANHPDQIPAAIEEFLRFEAPIQGFARKTKYPVVIGGRDIPSGELVWLNWGAANHDPEIFRNPGEIEIGRTPNRHFTFGIGKHLCTGVRLARAELKIVLETFLRIAPEFELADEGVVLPETIGQLLGKLAVHVKFPTRKSR